MELRVLQYFLAVAREQSISGAAQSLHLSQPTLSTQIKAMEEELGKQLLIRGTPGSRKVTLTEEGMILRKRAEEILDLVNRTTNEIALSDQAIAGDVYIGAGETDGIRLLTQVARKVQTQYPHVHFHISSGDGKDVLENLDKGLIDFGLLLQQVDISKYEMIEIPVRENWGVLMRKDAPLAQKSFIAPEDLWDEPLIISRQASSSAMLSAWLKKDLSALHIAATYSLLYNGSLMVEEGMGYALCLDKIINTSGDSCLCFRPFSPSLELGVYMVWKKYQVFSKAAEKYLDMLRKELDAFSTSVSNDSPTG